MSKSVKYKNIKAGDIILLLGGPVLEYTVKVIEVRIDCLIGDFYRHSINKMLVDYRLYAEDINLFTIKFGDEYNWLSIVLEQ